MAAAKMQIRRKIVFVLIVLFLLFAAVVIKLAFVQFVQGSELQQKAEELRTRDVPVAAERGTIYDRNGEKLAVSISADSISATPSEVIKSQKAESTALFLSRVLAMDYDTVYKKITSKSSFVWIKRKADFEVARQIREAQLPGIQIVEETQRFYPKGMLAANVLGFAGIDNQGLEGIEISRDKELSGVAGSIIGQYDAKNREIPQATEQYIAPRDGYNIVLTIDENIQYFCERELDKLMTQANPPKRASILIMNPNTGEILAMANRPSYDPNDYQDFDASTRRNMLVSDSYEPGSTFKIITTAAALEEGVVTPNDQFYDPGYAIVGKERIKCWRSYNPHGAETFAQGVQNSCNPVFVQVGLRLEAKASGLFYKYIKAFGFGDTTGIELSGEASGILAAEKDLKQINYATISIGQGIAVTPVQLVTAVSAVANGGTLLTPQLVRQVKDQDGKVIQDFQVKEKRRVVSKETAQTTCELLESVVAEGTGHLAYIPGYRVGGKTGTAQKAGVGGYIDGKYVASFVGIAPVNDPQIVALVIIDEPSGYPYQGGQIAAPVFKAVVEDTLHYMGVPSQFSDEEEAGMKNNDGNMVNVPDVVNLPVEDAKSAVTSAGFKFKTEGSGNIVFSQVPLGFASAEKGSTVVLKLAAPADTETNGLITVPDLTGKRLSEVAELLGAMGLRLSPDGVSGVACSQQPAAGVKVKANTTVTVKFAESKTP